MDTAEVRRLLDAAQARAAGLSSDLDAAQRRIEHLETALQTNRRIAMAIGVLMARRGHTEDQAFGVLRQLSQHTQRRIRDLAEEIVYTGDLPAADLPEAAAG